MFLKSKVNIADQLNKLTPLEAISGMVKSLHLDDHEQADKIFSRLPKDQKSQAWHFMHLYQQKLNAMQSIVLLKASLAMYFYQMLLGNMIDGNQEVMNPEDYDSNLEKQKYFMKEIEKIDVETNGVSKIAEIDDAFQGMSNYYDQWMRTAIKYSKATNSKEI